MENSEWTPQQYRTYYGKVVLSALRSIGREASVAELTKYIGKSFGESEDVIKPEVLQVLRRGILNGFLVRKGKNYSLSCQDNIVDIDALKKGSGMSLDQNLPATRLSEAPAFSSTTKTEPNLRSYGQGGSRNVLCFLGPFTDDSEHEVRQSTSESNSSDD